MEHSCEIISKSDQQFQRRSFFLRISSCPYSARSPHSPESYFWRIKISRILFEKGHLRNIPVKLFQNQTAVPEEKIFKELLKKFNFIAMATRVFNGIKFCEQFLKRTSQGTFLPSLVQIGPAVWEKLLTTHDGRRTPHHPKSSP